MCWVPELYFSFPISYYTLKSINYVFMSGKLVLSSKHIWLTLGFVSTLSDRLTALLGPLCSDDAMLPDLCYLLGEYNVIITAKTNSRSFKSKTHVSLNWSFPLISSNYKYTFFKVLYERGHSQRWTRRELSPALQFPSALQSLLASFISFYRPRLHCSVLREKVPVKPLYTTCSALNSSKN